MFGFSGGDNQRLRNENARLNRVVERLMSETGVREYLENANEEVDKAKRETRRFYDFWQSTKIKLKNAETRISELVKENKALKGIKVRLENAVSKLRKENERQGKKIAVLEEKSKGKDAKLAEREKEIHELKEELQKELDKREVAGKGNSVPTSQTPIGREKVIPHSPREKKYERRGGVEGHKGNYLKPLEESHIDKRVPHPCTKKYCDKCQTELAETGRAETRDYTDLVTIVVGIRHEYQIKICPCCGMEYHESIPDVLKYPNNYGPNMKSQLVWNMVIGNVSMNKNARFMREVSGGILTPTDGYMAKLLRKGSDSLKPFMYDLRIAAICQLMLYWDDTVIWINKSRGCLRFYGNENIAIYKAHLHKDADGLDEDGILQFLTVETTVMHDHNKINYNEKYRYTNVECIVHGQRDGYKYIQIAHRAEAQEYVDFITETIKERKKLIGQNVSGFGEKEKELFEALDDILSRWRKAAEKDENRYYQHDELVFVDRIKEYKENYFAWIRDFSLPTSNSLSERALRIAKSKTKISGQFFSEETSGFYADILSYVETCHRNGISEYDALKRLYEGNPYSIQEIIPEEHLRNFNEVKRAVRTAESSTQTEILEHLSKETTDSVDKENVAENILPEDEKLINPAFSITKQELMKLALNKLKEEMDRENNSKPSGVSGNDRDIKKESKEDDASSKVQDVSAGEIIDDDCPEVSSTIPENQTASRQEEKPVTSFQGATMLSEQSLSTAEDAVSLPVSNGQAGSESDAIGVDCADQTVVPNDSVIQGETMLPDRSVAEAEDGASLPASNEQVCSESDTVGMDCVDQTVVPNDSVIQGETMLSDRSVAEAEDGASLPASNEQVGSESDAAGMDSVDQAVVPNDSVIQGETMLSDRSVAEVEDGTSLPASNEQVGSEFDAAGMDSVNQTVVPDDSVIQGETMLSDQSVAEAEDGASLPAFNEQAGSESDVAGMDCADQTVVPNDSVIQGETMLSDQSVATPECASGLPAFNKQDASKSDEAGMNCIEHTADTIQTRLFQCIYSELHARAG
jgi:hypothetical protein